MAAAIYIRVSTDFQAEKGYSIEAQQDKLKAYCAINDIADYEMYIDGGYSGSNMERPALRRMLNDILAKKIDTVIVLKLDRLSRRTKDTLYLIEDVFNKNNIRFISLSENLDTNSSNGKFFITIMSSVAQLERENIKERTMMGAQKKAEKGIKSLSPKVLVGYDYDEVNKKFIANESEANQIRLIFDMFNSGKGVNYINRYMKNSGFECKNVKWGDVKQILNILDNETYTGRVFRYQGKFIPANNVERIIDDETFMKAKARRDYNKERYKRMAKSKYLLTGLLRCGYCGAPVRGYPSKYNYYTCYSRTGNHPHMNYASSCELKYLRMQTVDNTIIESLKKIAVSKIEFQAAKEDSKLNDFELKNAKIELSKIDSKLSKLYDLYIDEKISKALFDEKLATLSEQKTFIDNKIEELQKPQIRRVSAPNYSEFKELMHGFDDADIDAKRQLLFLVIDKILLYNDKIIIKWLF